MNLFFRFAVFGGAAIQMENQAQLLWKAGVELYNDPSYFQAGQGSNTAALFSGAYLDSPAPPGKTGTYKIEKLKFTNMCIILVVIIVKNYFYSFIPLLISL